MMPSFALCNIRINNSSIMSGHFLLLYFLKQFNATEFLTSSYARQFQNFAFFQSNFPVLVSLQVFNQRFGFPFERIYFLFSCQPSN